MGELIVGYRGAKALMLAAELNLIDSIEHTGGSARSIAARSKADARSVEVLLDALCALGFLRKKARRYFNTPFSLAVLHPDGKASLARNLRYQEFLSGAYADLLQTLRKGSPRRDLGALLSSRPDFVQSYMGGMVEIAKNPARELATKLDLSHSFRMLDVGGGPGVFSLALLARSQGLRATLLDLPETLRVARSFIDGAAGSDRLHMRGGNYHSASFGRNEYDLVLLSHVTHDEGERENQRLIRKAYSALRTGGQIVVHDFAVTDAKSGPLFPALFSLHLISYTAGGRVYSNAEYEGWLRGAGFLRARKITLCQGAPNETVAFVARKA